MVNNGNLHTYKRSMSTDTIIGYIDAYIQGRSIINIIDKQPTKITKIIMSEGLITAYLIPNIQVNMNTLTTKEKVKSEI